MRKPTTTKSKRKRGRSSVPATKWISPLAKKVGPEAQETEPEQAPAPTPYALPDPGQSADQPALVAAEDPAVLLTPVPAPAYPEPFYEE